MVFVVGICSFSCSKLLTFFSTIFFFFFTIVFLFLPFSFYRRPVLPDILVQVICWVLGEYAYLKGADAIAEVCDQICEVAERTHSTNSATRAYAITAVIKLTAQYGRATTSATALVLKYANSANSDLQQRCYEFMELSKMPHMMREVLPVDASYEDLEIDATLSFLNGIVQSARDKGMPDYTAPAKEDDGFGIESKDGENGGLNFTAYATPTVGSAAVVNGGLIAGTSSDLTAMDGSSGAMGSGDGSSSSTGANDMFNNLKVTKNVWGSSGFTGTAAGMNGSTGNSNDTTDAMGNIPGDYTTSSNVVEQPIEASIVPGVQQTNTSDQSPFGNENNTFTSSEPEVEPEPVISQREQEAMALFGGMPGSSGGTTTRTRTRTRRARQNRTTSKPEEETPQQQQQETQQPQQPQQAQQADSGDLLDLMGGGDLMGGSDTGSTGNSGNGGGNNMFSDLMGSNDNGGGGGESGNNNNNNNNNNNSGGLFDMGDMMGGMPSQPTLQQPSGLVPGGLGSTADFGQLWVSPQNTEVTQQIASFTIRTPEAFMECMQTKANLQGIQAISQTAEAICAGKDPNTNSIALLHGHVGQDGNVSIKVRSTDSILASRCLQIAVSALQ